MVKLLGFFCIYMFFAACQMVHAQVEPENKHIIYLSSIGWHTGIVVPAYTLPDSLWGEKLPYADNFYLEIGWGDEDFFTHPGFNLWYAIKAVFWPTSSVLHIRPIGRK